MTPLRAARITGASVIALTVLLAGIGSAGTPDGFDLGQTFVVALIPGIPVAFAAAVLVYRYFGAAGDGDLATRMVNASTSGLPASREEWGAAMRAELAFVDDPPSRWRFALGCVMTSLRISLTRESWLVVFAAGPLVAVLTLAASRISLAGGRAGILVATLYLPALVLFTTGLVTARIHRSFRSGLVAGALALVFSLIGMLAVAMIEGVHWQSVAGVFLMDGDAPQGGQLDRIQAALDPVSPFFVLIHLMVWVPSPVLGALVGGLDRRGDRIALTVSRQP